MSCIGNNKTSPSEDDYKKMWENGVVSSSQPGSSTNSQIDMSKPFRNPHGISWFVCALFLVDDLGGGGVVALPTAIVQAGLVIGLVVFFAMMFITMYTAHVLGECWNILLNTWPEYRVHCRQPYPEIAYRAMGIRARKFVSAINDVTQFGVTVVFLLLSSKNIQDMVKGFADMDLSYCFVILIVAAGLLPVTFLKSPQDFWGAVVVAMFTSAAGIVLILVGIALDYNLCSSHTEVPPLKPKTLFLAMGTILFSCGGHAAFPTIQHDMRNPGEYNKSVVAAFLMLIFVYVPVAILGYLTYHDAIRDSILPSIQTVWIQEACNVMITIHCILTVTIVLNPLNQDIEDLVRCPQHFGWQRMLVRTATMLAIVFVGESIPNFGPLLDLVGGSTMTLASVILPCLFYLFLISAQIKARETGKNHSQATIKDIFVYAPRRTLVISIFIMCVGIAGGVAATFSAVVELSTTSFLLPCYLNPFFHEKHPTDTKANVYCCGPYQNITHSGLTDMCVPMPAHPFYE